MARLGFMACVCALICGQSEGRSGGDSTWREWPSYHQNYNGSSRHSASPVETFNGHAKDEVHNLYTSFDYNRNGVFDRHDLSPFLGHYDVDRNGTVDQAEFESRFDMDEPTLAIVARGLFAQIDADGNNNIDTADVNAMFDRMDINRDGAVSRLEFEEFMVEVTTMIVVLQIQRQEFS